MEIYYLLIFNNTHNAIKCESMLKERDIFNVIMPTPTNITLSCGISIKIKIEDIDKIKKLINEAQITVKEIHKKEDNNYIRYF